MVNLNKLKLKIFENGMNISQLAEKIGVDKSTLYRKFQKNGDSISIKEANLMVETLHLTVEEANSIFFSQYVA
ncbi:helix-turn-helix transcriptional regulator [Clostridium perfringens]|uniref:helix-turn-helix domain-containing protein n=1 Tax=Clostridium perfringens TaxID=1502 RepID=UPI0030CD37C1